MKRLSTWISKSNEDQKVYKHPHVHVGMATVNISITREAYERLAALRKHKESFSDIINRLTNRTDLLQFAGILSKKSADRLERHVREFREGFQKASEARIKQIRRELQ